MTSYRKLFWKSGECFVADTNEDCSKGRNLKILKWDGEGDMIAVDAGMGLVGKDTLWDLNTMSVDMERQIEVLTPAKTSKVIKLMPQVNQQRG